MVTCPECGQENPEGFRHCGMCGALLVTERPPPREERKVVTVLFADLVGFTARAHQLDPEDVLTECFQWSIAPTDQGKGRSCLERGLR